MTTRRAKDKSVINQSRYASSADFERGLVANMVAKRCALIDSPADRELIWFIQYLSHQEGSLSKFAAELIAKYTDRILTETMAEMNLRRGKICNAETVKKLRPSDEEGFVLKGEYYSPAYGYSTPLDSEARDGDVWDGDELLSVERHVITYPSDKFFDRCIAAAKSGLEKHLCEMCLNPNCDVKTGPWYFPRLVETLQEFKYAFSKLKSEGVVVTALGQKVYETLDYTAYSRGLTLMQGDARTGKSFAARAWCKQRPGLARFIEVPPDNDKTGFFRSLARGLGIGNFLNYKAHEIRERVESVILNGDLVLVLDEAQRLWPQRNLRYGFPDRIVWIMTMANAGVPIAMVSTPQFVQSQNIIEKSGWNSAQLTGRISHFESLPVVLSSDDLEAVAKAVLPEASESILKNLATYAQVSARNLAAIDSISKRARYIAMRAGRGEADTEDVRKAMQESVIPADSKLQAALATGKKSKARTEPMAEHTRQSPRPVDQDTISLERRNNADLPSRASLSDTRRIPKAALETALTGH